MRTETLAQSANPPQLGYSGIVESFAKIGGANRLIEAPGGAAERLPRRERQPPRLEIAYGGPDQPGGLAKGCPPR